MSSSSSPIAPLELLFSTKCEDVKQKQQQQQPFCIDLRLGDGVVFRCPVTMLQEGSRTLSEMLESIESGETGTQMVELPFASVNSATFHSVAIYLEHFYGPTGGNVVGDKNGVQATSQSGRPATLSRPIQVRELYRLGDWEHRFVVQQLLLWPQDRWALYEEGRWVDVSATEAASAATQSIDQCNIQHLLDVLEAATALEVVPLRELCAAVIANLLLDLDDKNILKFMEVEETLGPEEEKALLKEFPWLNF
ncbi:hypothetical protein DQ04_02631030 [Trypanosoma grayi]|uniref:hypothetical protein n=1 Tax=Trypanosoma grayi TaxID=71804 RepID=UPI0004F45378|nr:hypothetical protein DQ04_02631030 [Trypanosoma grayi]KEG11428.1 hypothetical protein DQ04_02631030 [Trypanosoma grayi]